MNLSEFELFCKTYRFKKYSNIIKDTNNEVRFDRIKDNINEKHGWVCLWVEKTNSDYEDYEIVYVGTAGRTISQRCREYENRFRHSTTGKNYAERIRNGIADNKRYYLYIRKSDVAPVLDKADIPQCCVEKIAFIQKLSPGWN